jgi:large subunit ribosomal protein L24
MNRIQTGDKVIVISGKNKGSTGDVLSVNEKGVIVQGVNLNKKHVKPNPNKNQEGGIVSFEAPIHPSNVAHYNPNTKKPGKIGYKYIEENGVRKKVRYFKSDNERV